MPSLYVSKLEVYSVKTPELALARYPQGPLDGVDTDIIGHAREVGHSTLLYLLEKYRVLGRKGVFGLCPCKNDRQKHEQNALSQFINPVPGSQGSAASRDGSPGRKRPLR